MVLSWEPLTDLPEDWGALTDGELKPLLQFWNDQRADLEQSGALSTFTQRLSREWAIETGQIEGVYNIDRGITETLIERGIRADLIPAEPGQRPPEIVAAIIQDHLEVLEGLFQFIKGERDLTKGYIHELHAALLHHQETTTVQDQFGNFFSAQLLKGRYKERPNNPKRPDGIIHQYAPPEQVDSEMERLLHLHGKHEQHGVPVEVEAAWLHHRFTQIHPYQDGNGRVARALASLIFLKSGWFPVVVTRDDRARYIEVLEVADEGDLRSLVSYFANIQKRALFHAIRAASDVVPVTTVAEAIAAAKLMLTDPVKDLESKIWLTAKKSADHLTMIAEHRLDDLCASLKMELGAKRPDFEFFTSDLSSPVLLHLDYSPNITDYYETTTLVLKTEQLSTIEMHVHAVGPKFRGIIGFVMIFQQAGDSQLAAAEPFQVNYAESLEAAERRFRPWLEQSLINALTMWRKTL